MNQGNVQRNYFLCSLLYDVVPLPFFCLNIYACIHFFTFAEKILP